MGDSALLTYPCVLNVFVLFMSSRIILQLLACTINIVTIVICAARYVIYVENVLECLGLSYVIRKCSVDSYKGWAKNRTKID